MISARKDARESEDIIRARRFLFIVSVTLMLGLQTGPDSQRTERTTAILFEATDDS